MTRLDRWLSRTTGDWPGAISRYIPNDAAFGYQTFEVLSSRCKPGYAESAIVNGPPDLMADAKRAN